MGMLKVTLDMRCAARFAVRMPPTTLPLGFRSVTQTGNAPPISAAMYHVPGLCEGARKNFVAVGLGAERPSCRAREYSSDTSRHPDLSDPEQEASSPATM